MLLNNVSGCVIFGSGVVAEEVQPQGGGRVRGCWSFVWPEMDRHRAQLPGLVGRAAWGLEHTEVSFTFGAETSCGRKRTVSWKRHMSRVKSGFIGEGLIFQMSLFSGFWRVRVR